jgi:hypothetical protein
MTTRNAGPRGISEERIVAQTGKDSAEWTAILDAWDAPSKGHTASARYLVEEHGVSGWWAQTLTVRYEWERGLRVEAVVSAELAAALDAAPVARARFDALSTSHRHEYIRWVAEAKRPETRERRAAQSVARILTDT